MSKLKWITALFFLVEITAFVIVGKLVGLLMTLLLVVLTTMAGFAVIRDQGLASAYQSVQMMQGGRQLDPEQMPNPIKMIAGLLLIVPGFVTDTIGIIMLLPPVRHFLQKKLMRSGVIFDARVMGAAANESVCRPSHLGRGDTIEGEFERKDND